MSTVCLFAHDLSGPSLVQARLDLLFTLTIATAMPFAPERPPIAPARRDHPGHWCNMQDRRSAHSAPVPAIGATVPFVFICGISATEACHTKKPVSPLRPAVRPWPESCCAAEVRYWGRQRRFRAIPGTANPCCRRTVRDKVSAYCWILAIDLRRANR